MNKSSSGNSKYREISRANKTMFAWVAAVSVVAGFSIVIGIFMFQKVVYSAKVITAQEVTEKRLKDNLGAIDKLKSEIRLLDTNEDLMSTRLKDDDRAIQSVLDALPADANSTALASSLQKKLLSVPGVTLESLTIDSGAEAATESVQGVAEVQEIGFSFAVSSDQSSVDALREVLLQIERSIRSIHVVSLKFESQSNKRLMTVSAKAYYQPPMSVESKEVEVKP